MRKQILPLTSNSLPPSWISFFFLSSKNQRRKLSTITATTHSSYSSSWVPLVYGQSTFFCPVLSIVSGEINFTELGIKHFKLFLVFLQLCVKSLFMFFFFFWSQLQFLSNISCSNFYMFNFFCIIKYWTTSVLYLLLKYDFIFVHMVNHWNIFVNVYKN